MNDSPVRWRYGRRVRLIAGVALAGATITGVAACGSSEPTPSASLFPTGTPSEVSSASTGFPAPNGDMSNTRAVGGKIDSSNIGTLTEAWSMPLTGQSPFFGVFSSNPIVTADTVYLQDINSNVFAVDRTTGEKKWTRTLGVLTTGPNGVAIGDGVVIAPTATGVVALDAATGEIKWEKKVTTQSSEGVDMAPLVWNDSVIISSVPGASYSNFYGGGGMGIVYALDLATGEQKWSFNTTTDNLWGNPEVNSGGGLWSTPSVDDEGNIYLGVANPGPWPGTTEYPNGTSRPGDNLYTNSLVVLDGRTGKLKWYWQAIKHDLRDWDLHLAPILADFDIDGKSTPVVVVGGKMGTVYVVDRTTHKPIWQTNVGKHTPEAGAKDGKGTANDPGPGKNAPFTSFPTTSYPGRFGGVETNMAVSDGVIYVPVNNLCAIYSAGGSSICDFKTGGGQLVALDGATGKVLWDKDVGSQNYGGATVVNDAVVTITFDGKIQAFKKADGTAIWTKQMPASANATPAITDDMIIAGAGFAAGEGQKPAVVAYKLP